MHFATALIILSLGLFFCVMSTEGSRCRKVCTREHKPVCGQLKRPQGKILRCTFANSCLLGVRRCKTGEAWTSKSGECAKDSTACKRLIG